jgi:hypothetical protein
MEETLQKLWQNTENTRLGKRPAPWLRHDFTKQNLDVRFISKMTMLFKVRCLFHRFFGGALHKPAKGQSHSWYHVSWLNMGFS